MILIALGANLDSRFGVPEQTLRAVLPALVWRGVQTLQSSHIWITKPVPVSSQPDYRNSVISVRTDLRPQELLAEIHDIEKEFGRERAEKNAARVIDLDLLVYGNEVAVAGDDLILPHPEMHRRGFVLYPMREVVDEEWRHPVFQKTVDEMITELSTEQRLVFDQRRRA